MAKCGHPAHFILRCCVVGPLLAFLPLISGLCEFPSKWEGDWFQSGRGDHGPVIITRYTISGTLKCLEKGKANRHVIYDEQFKCYKCMVINMKHYNVIQYKESHCDQAKDLTSLCMAITGDAILFSMFRVGADPVSCPFHGPLTFTYSKGYGECVNPVSQEELVCLAVWKEGSNHYLVGKINHTHANNDEDRYRCFIFERPRHQPSSAMFYVAQSADATCQGLVFAHEGSKTMKLNKTDHNGKKCHFPRWFHHHPHWHTLDYRQSYYIYHHNTTLRISNGTAAPEDPEERGQTDVKLVCDRYLDGHKEHQKDVVSSGDSRHANKATLVVHVTVGCRSGYKCMTIYKRDDHVVQIQFGDLAYHPEEACTPHYWDPSTTNVVTLVAQGDHTHACGPLGKYVVPNLYVQQACKDMTPTFTRLTVGCTQSNTLQLHASCPEDSIKSYQCHSQWETEGVTYIVASPLSRPSGSPRRVCFAYSPSDDLPYDITFTARHDTCIAQRSDAHIFVNFTLDGHCTKASSINSSSVGLCPNTYLLLLLSACLSAVLTIGASIYLMAS